MPKHEVVISGISGIFPDSDNLKIFEENLFAGKNMVTPSGTKKQIGDITVTPYQGSIKETLCDNSYFGITPTLHEVMDDYIKWPLMACFEALCDAGINPESVRGTRTGVIITSMASEIESTISELSHKKQALVGFSKSMQANRLSYSYDFRGPSIHFDSSWVAPMQAIELAANMMANGHIEMAIVSGSQQMIFPNYNIHFECIKKLNQEGKTKSFSADAEGHNRSSGMVLLVLQRAEDALRSYGTVVKSKAGAEMTSPSVITDPCGYDRFISDFYSELNIKNSDIAYIEGDGCASKALDAMELNGLSQLCKGRDKPLLVGSIKSKVGHCEGAAPLMGLLHAALAFKRSQIPPTLHFTAPNPDAPALQNGKMKVVTEVTPLEGDYIGVSAMGFCSLFGHLLLKKNPKSAPVKDESYFPPDKIPRIFLMSGRDEDNIKIKLNEVLKKKPVDENLYALNYKVFNRKIPNFLYRGFSMVNQKGKTALQAGHCEMIQPPVWFILSGMGCQWNGMGTSLLTIPVVRRALERCHKVLEPMGVDLMHIITTGDPTIFDKSLNGFVGITAIQIALADLLEALGIKPDGMVGHSAGEVACAYIDKCLTAEQSMLAAYYRGKAISEANLVKGIMAAVGRGYNDIKDELPEGIEVACHNSSTSCTLSGAADIMEKYVDQLKEKGVFARLVNVSNIAYHSKNVKPAGSILINYLKQVIPEPKLRSKKWISSSVSEDRWGTFEGKYCSAEYQTNNLLGYVLFEEATSHIPPDAICIEIAPHGLLQAIIKKSLPSCTHIPLTNRKDTGDCFFLVDALGKLFMSGLDPDFSHLYPPVEFPVPRETDFLDVVTWDFRHQEKGLKELHEVILWSSGVGNCNKQLVLRSNESLYLYSSYQIQNKPHHLKSTLLFSIMKYLNEYAGKNSIGLNYYSFQNLKFWRDLPYSLNENTNVNVMFQFTSSNFEAICNNNNIVTGCLSPLLGNLPDPLINPNIAKERGKQIAVSENEIYDFFRENGVVIKSVLRNITSVVLFEKGFVGKVKWDNVTDHYLDSIFKLLEFYWSVQKSSMMVLDQILQMLLDPREFPKEKQDVDIYYDEVYGYLIGPGVRIFIPQMKLFSPAANPSLQLKSQYFLPYSKINPEYDFLALCLQIFKENSNSENMLIGIIADQADKTSNQIIQDLRMKDPGKNYQIHISKADQLPVSNANHCYLVIGNEKMANDIERLMSSQSQFYFICTGSTGGLHRKLNHLQLSSIIEQDAAHGRLVLYKQTKPDLSNCDFIKMSENDMKLVKAIASKDVSIDKPSFLLFRYRFISDIVGALQSIYDTPFFHKRLVFMDDSCPEFDPNNDFFKKQLLKCMKVNIAQEGVWGSLRDRNVGPQSILPCISHAYTPTFNHLWSKNVDLNVIGVNLQTINYPRKHMNFGVIDYSGTRGGKQIFGLGRLVEGNCFDVDEHLWWEKPKHWSMEEAATIPLYYAMAYDMLRVKGKDVNRKKKSLLTHSGQTPLSLAIIRVALSMQMKVYVTCFNCLQKQYLMNQFPQLEESKVYVLADKPNFYAYDIFESTNGKGVDIVVDSFEDPKLRDLTFQCSKERGIYFLLTHNNMDTDYAYGLSLVEKENSLTGYNPEMIFEMSTSDKFLLRKILEEGIKSGVVKPLESYSMNGSTGISEVANTVISKSHEEFPKKIILPLKVQKGPKSRESITKKNYIIIGGHSNLWYDMLRWLLSKNVDKINIILNQNQVPKFVKESYRELVAKFKHTKISVEEIEHFKTAESWNELITSLNQGQTLDTIFYVTQGTESQLMNVDNALRNHGRNSRLVTLGAEASSIIEMRLKNGLKGVSCVLAGNTLKKSTIVNALDMWMDKSSEYDNIIVVKEARLNAIKGKSIKTNFLPSSNQELVELVLESSTKPYFIEITTRSLDKKHAREINPVFIFPGFKLSQISKFASGLLYPAFIAKYPLAKTSLKELASEFSKQLMSSFDYNMFTLVAEGWSGPLVLEVAALLEEHDKQSEIILLEGAPETIRRWYIETNSILNSFIPSSKKGKEISIRELRGYSSTAKNSICKDVKGDQSVDDMLAGLDCLIDRLEMTEGYKVRERQQESTVFLFTVDKYLLNQIDLKKTYPSFNNQIVESSILDDPQTLGNVNNLVLVEFKTRSGRQSIRHMATLDFLQA